MLGWLHFIDKGDYYVTKFIFIASAGNHALRTWRKPTSFTVEHLT
ncbi:hypothetical protein LCGC14_0990250 [marine sediment metagenome]|uniref:Uncharacterized protein n=1 Tax=marine sediment metagenome TaxID=412755 RepID=A0A0F9RCM2_9ZZZZ